MVCYGKNSDAVTRKYTWGLDLSELSGGASRPVPGPVHGAGGIGGLLAVEETATTGQPAYWFFYDGNGNVGQLVKASDQSTVAHYEYDPYGNTIVIDDVDESGYANANPFRFSTKWLDDELAGASVNGAVGDTGLYYFGYRYYSPRLGRWLNRDPIDEKGGPNLYGYTEGNPISHVDFLGLKLPTKKLGQPCSCPCPKKTPPDVFGGLDTKWCVGITLQSSFPYVKIYAGVRERTVNLVCADGPAGYCQFAYASPPNFGKWGKCKKTATY